MLVARTTIDVGRVERLYPASFVSDDGRAVAWVELGSHEAGLFGSPQALRELATVAIAAADQAEEMQRLAAALRTSGIGGREAA